MIKTSTNQRAETMEDAPERRSISRTCNATRAKSVQVRSLAVLADRYEAADAYNRAALEPVIRKAFARISLDEGMTK
jgi:hypothetical protein